ncbi:MAG: acetylxylan esterase [Anaerolineae bacterium]|nr:acetylxylan esterase [Anaerolineae bacterium]
MRSDDEVEVFEAHYDSLDGLCIAGWYCLPRQRDGRDKPLPTIVVYPGYISEPTLPKDWARQGYAAFGAAPRGKLRSNARFNPGYPGLLTHNITDKNTYGYKGFYVDAIRAIDFLLAQPDVDPARIGLTGGSQGGALTILVAAMRNDVVAAAAPQAPYLCGYMDSAKLTHTYPYEEMNEYAACTPAVSKPWPMRWITTTSSTLRRASPAPSSSTLGCKMMWCHRRRAMPCSTRLARQTNSYSPTMATATMPTCMSMARSSTSFLMSG